MDATVSIKDLLLFLLGAGGVVLIVYLIILVNNLVKTLKSLNVVLKDAETIASILAERAQDVDGIIDDVSTSVGTIAKNLKGNQGVVKTVSYVISLFTSLKGLFAKKVRNGSEPKDKTKDKK